MAKQQAFTPQDVDRAKAILKGLPSKPKEKASHLVMPEFTKEIRTEIRAAMRRGYSLDDIVSALNKDSFDLKTPTLKRYYYMKGKKAKPKAEVSKDPKPARASYIQPQQVAKKEEAPTGTRAVRLKGEV